MGRWGVCMAGALILLPGCAPKKEFDIIRQQSLEYLTRIDELKAEARQRDRAIDEYRGALASATTMLRELRQQNQDEEADREEAERKLSEMSRRWEVDQRRIASYEAQLSQARADLEEVRRRLSGSAGQAAAGSRPADETQEASSSHE